MVDNLWEAIIMCNGSCKCKEHIEEIHKEMKDLILQLDMKLSELEFFAIKNRLLYLADELK